MREKTAVEQYVKTLLSYPPLTLDEELTIYYNLFAPVKVPGSAKLLLVNRLIESHMPLAVKIARQYINRGIEFEDLLDITVTETIRLAHLYNPGVTHKYRFGTILPSRLKKAIRHAFKATKDFRSQRLYESIVFAPNVELNYTIKKILRDCFTEEECKAIAYRWEGKCTLKDTSQLIGKSPSWVSSKERKAKELVKEVLE